MFCNVGLVMRARDCSAACIKDDPESQGIYVRLEGDGVQNSKRLPTAEFGLGRIL